MSTPQSANASEAAYLDWIKAWVDEDKKSTLLLVAFDLATISLILSSKAGSDHHHAGVTFGLLLLLGSAGCLYMYYAGLHLALRNLKPNGIALPPNEIDTRFDQLWSAKKVWFRAGSAALIAGVIDLALAII